MTAFWVAVWWLLHSPLIIGVLLMLAGIAVYGDGVRRG